MIYTPLGIKTDYSLLSSMIKIKDLISFALNNNIKSLSIADDNMSGVIEFYKACTKNNIKPVIGLRINIENKEYILYAKNYKGYKNLIKIESLKNENNLNYNTIKEYSSNIICIIPFEYKDDYNVLEFETKFIGFKNDEEYIDERSIYFNDILYLDKNDKAYFKYLLAIKDGIIIDKVEYDGDNYLDLNVNTINNNKIYEMCDVKLEFNKSLIPKYNVPKGYTSHEYLKYLCKEGLKKKFGSTVGIKYIERLKYELSIIEELNFSDYFLIVWDYVNFAKDNGILIGPGRGSSAGSLVSYCLNIVEVDPLKYDLLFERFLNKERVTMPDIDVDFDGLRKEEVIDYCKKKYGNKNVAHIITFNSLTAKQVIRDVGKVMNIEGVEIDYFAKMFKPKMDLKENYENSDRIKNHLTKNPELKKVFEIALKLENIKKHTSEHASGVVISSKEIDEVIPLEKDGDTYLTGYTMEYLEEFGLIKMDFLSLKTLTTIESIISDIKDLDFNNIPLNDIKTFELFNKGNTTGIFQFESEGMIKFLSNIKPRNFEEIYNVMALYRPGPMGNIENFIKRRNGEPYDCFDESLEQVLKPTYGIIIYQEQIMRIAFIMANYTLGEADVLRRAMSKKKEEILLKEKDKFINRSIENGYTEELSKKIYDLILKFAEYGFPKAHAVAYSIISYKMAYIKANYPKEFMKHMLNESLGSPFELSKYVKECKENNVIIKGPDINKSDIRFIIEDDFIRYPFLGVKDLGLNMALTIINERKDPFKDIFDFVKRIDRKIINKNVFENLILSGCFDSFNLTRKTLKENIDILYNYADLASDIDIEKPILEEYEEYSMKELMNFEYKMFSIYLNNHPVNEYRKKLDSKVTISNISSYLDRYVTLIAKVDTKRETRTKDQKIMCFIKVSDEFSSMDGIIFSNSYKDVPKFKNGDIIKMYGKISRKEGTDRIIINRLGIIDEYN